MFGIASLGQRTDPARARGAANAGPVRQAVCATWQERCSRCGSDLRSGGSPDDAVRDNQDDRAAGRADAPPRARAPREAADHVGKDDADPRILPEARIAMRAVADLLCDLQTRIKHIEQAIRAWHSSNEASRRL